MAEKYQTGFDQPLLHTMYVDKRLAGIQAVQTLSRLNRTHPGKDDTFVLDFVNEPEDILEAFKPYYEATLIGERADPGQLYQLKARLDAAGVYHWSEVEEFARIFYKPKNAQHSGDHQRLNACLDTAVKRFSELEETEREELCGVFADYRNLYAFLAQIIPFGDSELEKLYSYIRFLLTKLPKRDIGSPLDLEGEVALKYYRLEKTADDISIELGSDGVVDGPTEVGTGVSEKQSVYLSQLIDILNDRFGTNFASGDQLFFDSIKEDIKADEKIRQAATVNTLENFGFAFNKVLENFIINRVEQNEEMVARFFNDKEFRSAVNKHLQEDVYREIRGE
ncbi:MAG TPA: type I restriction endonuclease subunit R [Actinobacteria bacterium]|nr:type I restriction endonuclease subunit R [Actinomycetes bacterium]HEX21239.1 type I restriction endonuclease subunit R [Actinomycetota bacterium]